MQVYSNTMKDAPQLTNEWGALTKILDFIFQDFAAMNFTKIETYDNGIAKITYNQTTDPLVLGQSINVTGTVNYNKEFLVTAISLDGLTATIENRSIVKNTASETGAFKMKLTDCPIKKLHGSAAEQRIVFQLKNGWVARIDDRPIGPLLTPAVTWPEDRGKFARVAIAEGSNNVDNLTGMQMPYNSSMPTLNIAPVNDYVGNAVFLYNTYDYSANNLYTANLNTANNFNRPIWHIVVDENFFWFDVIIDSTANIVNSFSTTRNIMISEYDSFYSTTGKGMALYAYTTTSQTDTKYNSTNWQLHTNNSNVIFKITSQNAQYNTWMYDDSFTSGNPVSFTVFPLMSPSVTGSTVSGTSNGGSLSVALINNKVILSETLLIQSSNNMRGINRYLTWVLTQWNDINGERLYGKIYSLENNRYFIVHQYYQSADPNNSNAARGLIKLKVPK